MTPTTLHIFPVMPLPGLLRLETSAARQTLGDWLVQKGYKPTNFYIVVNLHGYGLNSDQPIGTISHLSSLSNLCVPEEALDQIEMRTIYHLLLVSKIKQ